MAIDELKKPWVKPEVRTYASLHDMPQKYQRAGEAMLNFREERLAARERKKKRASAM